MGARIAGRRRHQPVRPVADLIRWNCPYVDLDISDDSFSMMMTEWLWEDVESFEYVFGLPLSGSMGMRELREHLKQFEDKEEGEKA